LVHEPANLRLNLSRVVHTAWRPVESFAIPTFLIWWSHSPALRQCRLVHFLWLVQKPGMDFQ